MDTELRVTAFGRSSGGTISEMKACRAGLSKTFTKPSASASRYTDHIWMTCIPVRIAKIAASPPDSACVAYRMRRLFRRSANRPPAGPKTRIGRNRTASTRPRSVPLCVRSRTRKDWATVCIQVPITETSCPKKNRR
jgi:hypothetical protein